MIGFIRGRVIGMFPAGKNVVSLVVAPFGEGKMGVAYTILFPLSDAKRITIGEQIALWTFAVYSDKDSYLIGFTTEAKVMFFLSLVSVSGVGPRSAMMILSVLTTEECKSALQEQNAAVFGKVPGIGRKTAAKIVLELSDKEIDVNALVSSGVDVKEKYSDVQATLIKLGYSTQSAKEAINTALSVLDKHPDKSTAEKVTLVLSRNK